MHLMMVAQKRAMYKRRLWKEKERRRSFLAVLYGGLSFPLLRHAGRELDIEVFDGEFARDEAGEKLIPRVRQVVNRLAKNRHTALVEVNDSE
jgi:hypothetical protein